MNDTVLSLIHIVYQPQYEMCNCLAYSLLLTCAFFSFARCVQNKEFFFINNIIIVEKKWCDVVDLKRQVKEFLIKPTTDSEQKSIK